MQKNSTNNHARPLSLVAAAAIGLSATVAHAQEAEPSLAQPASELPALDEALEGAAAMVDPDAAADPASTTEAAPSSPTWRFIARWLGTSRFRIRHSHMGDADSRISRRSSDPRAQGWRISLPDFAHDRIVPPPQAVAHRAAQASQTRSAAASSEASPATGAASPTQTATVSPGSDD